MNPTTITNGHIKSNGVQESKKGSKRNFGSLPIKKFEVRESLITTLSDNPHIRVVKNIFAASLVGLLLNTVAHDYFKNGEIKVGITVIVAGFGKLHIVAASWIILNICAVLCFYCFHLWANVRVNFPPKAQNVKIWDSLWMLSILGYYVLQFRMVSILVRHFDLPIASSSILCLEQTRLLMKIHAFIRSNVEKVAQFKPHSDEKLKLASTSHYLYFLFAPTLVYMDEYPRTAKIRWTFVMERLIELVGVVFYYAFLLERFIIPSFKDVGLRPFSKSELFLLMLDNSIVGLMFLLLGFYVVLHTTQNLGAELLRFGDRKFYMDWWTATNYSDYFRMWNMVVGDWLYTYVYRDCYNFRNKAVAKVLVFMISAIVHEWVLTYMFGFFFPALFLCFLFSGCVLAFFPMPKLDIINIFFWYVLSFGCGSLVSLYSAEYFLRVNFPVERASFKDFLIPRLFTCNCTF